MGGGAQLGAGHLERKEFPWEAKAKNEKEENNKKGAERKHLHSQNQSIKQLGEAWRSHKANPTPKRKWPTLGTNPFSLFSAQVEDEKHKDLISDGVLGASGATSITILSLHAARRAITATEESSNKVRKGNLIRTFEP